MELKTKFFDELSARELYEIAVAREKVFLLERNIVCQDLDGVDYDSLHCFFEEEGRVCAYLRAYRAEGGEVQIGRVLTTSHGKGLGKRLMTESMIKIKEIFDCDSISLHAQKQAEGFYAKLGFVTISPEFLEEGVVHVTMKVEL